MNFLGSPRFEFEDWPYLDATLNDCNENDSCVFLNDYELHIHVEPDSRVKWALHGAQYVSMRQSGLTTSCDPIHLDHAHTISEKQKKKKKDEMIIIMTAYNYSRTFEP